MTPLGKKMIEDMKLHGFAQRTRETYLYAVSKLAKHFGKSPERITNQQLRRRKSPSQCAAQPVREN